MKKKVTKTEVIDFIMNSNGTYQNMAKLGKVHWRTFYRWLDAYNLWEKYYQKRLSVKNNKNN